jgi:Tat protein secretion system quality control protein TatD with DNase activity
MPSCPCCAFGASDLFLPAGVTEAAEASPPAQPAQPAPSRHDDDADAKEDEELPLPSAQQVWQALQQASSAADANGPPWLFDSHGHAHLTPAEKDNELPTIYDVSPHPPTRFASLTCAVAPADWAACLDYAAQSPTRVAALGVHPWYVPEIEHDEEDAWLATLERQLQAHPGVAVGEIGLCKVAKWVRTSENGKATALARQRHVLEQQLDLAAAYQRPVSLHCVQQQAALLDILKIRTARATTEAARRAALPPTLALHSFSGTAHHVQQLLQWEAFLAGRPPKHAKQKASAEHATTAAPPLVYFGISHAVNYGMASAKARRQGRAAIRCIPLDRLLAESDVSGDREALGGTLLAVAYLAAVREEPLVEVARRTTANALRFLQSLQGAESAAAVSVDPERLVE